MSDKKKIVVLTGAGISAESGIKTFRDLDGLWYEHKVEDVASLAGWKRDRQLVLNFYNERRKGLDTVEPNKAHTLLADLEKEYEVVVITQNVDDLHERGGSTNIIHLHGELRKMCSSNNKNLTLPYDRDIMLGDKHEDGSQLRPFIVWFGEAVPKIEDAAYQVSTADILVIIGTSLQVYPAAGLLDYVKEGVNIYYLDKDPSIDTSMYSLDVLRRINYLPGLATEGVARLIDLLKENET